MSLVNNASKRVARLKQQPQELEAAIKHLTPHAINQKQELDSLWAQSERSGKGSFEDQVGKAEASFDDLQRQKKRKRAALQACVEDLESARAALDHAERLAAWKEIKGLTATIEELAAELDSDPTDAEGWAELQKVAGNIQSLYLGNLKGNGRGEYHTILPPIENIMDSVLEAHQVNCNRVVNGLTAERPSVPAMLKLDKIKARVKSLQP